MRRSLLLVIGLGVLVVTRAEGQSVDQHNGRRGGWFKLGFGVGNYGCETCPSRLTGVTGHLSVGGTINPRWQVGASVNSWGKTVDGVNLNLSSATVTVRSFPSPASGSFFQAGVGGAMITLSEGYDAIRRFGSAVVIGIGHDIIARRSPNFGVTPYANWTMGSFKGGTADSFQVGIAIGAH